MPQVAAGFAAVLRMVPTHHRHIHVKVIRCPPGGARAHCGAPAAGKRPRQRGWIAACVTTRSWCAHPLHGRGGARHCEIWSAPRLRNCTVLHIPGHWERMYLLGRAACAFCARPANGGAANCRGGDSLAACAHMQVPRPDSDRVDMRSRLRVQQAAAARAHLAAHGHPHLLGSAPMWRAV